MSGPAYGFAGKRHSVTSARVDLAIDNNGTWQDAFQFGTPGDTTWNLNGQNFEVEVKRNSYDTVELLLLTTSNGRIVVDDPVQRVIHFNVSSTDIRADLNPGCYVYDLVMYNGAVPSIRVPLMHGVLEVTQGVSAP